MPTVFDHIGWRDVILITYFAIFSLDLFLLTAEVHSARLFMVLCILWCFKMGVLKNVDFPTFGYIGLGLWLSLVLLLITLKMFSVNRTQLKVNQEL